MYINDKLHNDRLNKFMLLSPFKQAGILYTSLVSIFFMLAFQSYAAFFEGRGRNNFLLL